MARNHYKNFLRLLEKWHVDESKKGRDLGEYIRKKISKNFHQGETTKISDPDNCLRIYESLNRLARNVHANKYPRHSKSTAIGISPEATSFAVSNEYLDTFKKQ